MKGFANKCDTRRMDKKHESTLRSFDMLDGRELNFRMSETRKGQFKDATMFSSDVTQGYQMTSKMSERRRSTKSAYQIPNIVQKFQPFIEEEDPLTLSVSCALHLGVLEDARKLPCEHAFCLACLQTFLNSCSSSRMQCPVCCQECDVPTNGACDFPSAKFHNELAARVRNRRSSLQSINSGQSGPSPCGSVNHLNVGTIANVKQDNRRRGSILQSADLLRDLVKKLSVKGQSVELIERTLLESDLKQLESKLETLHMSESPKMSVREPTALERKSTRRKPVGRASSQERKYEMHNQAEIMRRCAKYKMQSTSLPSPIKEASSKRKSVISTESASLTVPEGEKTIPEDVFVVCSHIGTYKKNHHKVYAILDSTGWVTLRLSNKSKLIRFRPLADEQEESFNGSPFQGIYMKVALESVFISGMVNMTLPKDAGQPAHITSAVVGCILRYDLNGTLLYRSEPYPVTCKEHNPVHGFDVDERNGRVFLCKPCSHEVGVLNADLSETGQQWCFLESNIRLTYVCYCSDANELWSTCAVKQALLYLDLNTNDYRLFFGESLFKSSPTHIICTSDQRVIFLDESEGRLYWVSRCNSYLCIQRLIVRNTRKSFRPEWLQNIEDGYIMFDNGRYCYVGGPTRDLNLNKRTSCILS